MSKDFQVNGQRVELLVTGSLREWLSLIRKEVAKLAMPKTRLHTKVSSKSRDLTLYIHMI